MKDVRLLPFCLVVLFACATTTQPVRTQQAETGVMPPIPKETTGFVAPVPVGPISAPGEVVEEVPGGAVDWGERVVRARGTGVADPGIENKAQARLMAERAAIVVAQRNLLEIIKGVRIDSDTKVENYLTSYDVVYSHVEGIIRGARQVGPTRFDSLTGTAEVEMEVALSGPQSVAEALAPVLAGSGAGGMRNAEGGRRNAEGGGRNVEGGMRNNVTPQVRDFFRQYSGLVLDAAGSGLKPALFPKIYDESGNLLLDTKDYAGRAEGLVQFVARLDEVLSRPEFANQPLVLKVKEIRGRLGTDIVLSRQDAERLKWLKQAGRLLFDAGRFIVKLMI
ncbi:MAG: hypothetical protein ABIK44_07810 [candidate division WOR-3 bacterium]